MRFYVISIVVFIPALALLSLLRPLIMGSVERPIGPEIVVSQVDPGDPARGETLFKSKCYGCHVPQANIGPRLDSQYIKARFAEDEMLAFAIRSGREPMPAFTVERLNDQQLADIIAYLRLLPPQN